MALTIPGVVKHYESIIGELEKPPILMGHSMGGLIVQILLDHGYGAAGVAIESLRHSPTRFIQLLQRVYACLTPSHWGGCKLSMDLGVLLSFSQSFQSPQPSGWTFPPPLSAARLPVPHGTLPFSARSNPTVTLP